MVNKIGGVSPHLWINGSRVLVVWTDWALPWFECPQCGRRCRHIFLDELACRIVTIAVWVGYDSKAVLASTSSRRYSLCFDDDGARSKRAHVDREVRP